MFLAFLTLCIKRLEWVSRFSKKFKLLKDFNIFTKADLSQKIQNSVKKVQDIFTFQIILNEDSRL